MQHLFYQKIKKKYKRTALFCLLIFFSGSINAQDGIVQQPKGSLKLQKASGNQARYEIFILTGDHRFDALEFLKLQTFIETQNLGRMAKGGAYLPNAFVTTSLCSPSRASILTGLYALLYFSPAFYG